MGAGASTPLAAAGSTVNDHVTLRLWVVALTVYVPGPSGSRGTTTSALSPCRIECAAPLVLPANSVHVVIGPFGPVMIDETEAVTASGIMAMTGNPAWPDQWQKSSGLGDSVMNWPRLVVVPLPGNTIGVPGRGPLPRPESTFRVAPECHGEVLVLSHLP